MPELPPVAIAAQLPPPEELEDELLLEELDEELLELLLDEEELLEDELPITVTVKFCVLRAPQVLV